MSAYDSIADLSDVNVRPQPLPDGSDAVVEMREPPTTGLVGKNNEPVIELKHFIKTGPATDYEVRTTLWVNTVVKPGNKQSAFDSTKRTLKEIILAYTADAQAVNGFFRGCSSENEIAQRLATLVGKPIKVVLSKETVTGKKGAFDVNRVKQWVPATPA